MGAVQSVWLQSRPSSSLASSSLIITSQVPAHAVQFTPQFRCFPYSASFQSLSLAQKSQLRDRGLNTVNVLHRKGTGPTDLMQLVRILNVNATEWSFEWRGGFFFFVCLTLYWILQFGSTERTRGLSGPERAAMAFQHVLDIAAVLCGFWFFFNPNVYWCHMACATDQMWSQITRVSFENTTFKKKKKKKAKNCVDVWRKFLTCIKALCAFVQEWSYL